jgi:cation:H+ antiporter
MIWVQFFISAAIIVLAANRLAAYADAISLRTSLGGMFIGTLLLSLATSLPELLTTISSISQSAPDLAVGNIFGSSMFNMLMLAILDLGTRRVYILRSVAITHTLTSSLAVLLTGTAVFFLLGDFSLQIGWVGLDSIVLIGLYVFAVYIIRASNSGGAVPPEPTEAELKGVPTLRHALTGFALTTGALIVVTPLMVDSAIDIAEITGLSTGFIGTTLVALVTSLPELVTTITAGRIGAYDLAVGNLFGSNIFNIFTLALADLFFIRGRFLSRIPSTLTMAGVMGLILTTLGMIGILAHIERRSFMLQINLLLVAGYLVGMAILFT